MESIEKTVQEMLNEGFTEEQIVELLQIASEEIEDTLFVELGKRLNDQEVEQYEIRAKNASTTQEKEALLEEMASVFFGSDAYQKMAAITVSILNETRNLTKSLKQMEKAYQAGDPVIRKQAEDAMKDPRVQKLMEKWRRE